MDTLGGRESAGPEPANDCAPRAVVGQPAAAPSGATAESALDLLRPSVLFRLLNHDQTTKFITVT